MTQVELIAALLRAESKKGGYGPINWEKMAEKLVMKGWRVDNHGDANKIDTSRDR